MILLGEIYIKTDTAEETTGQLKDIEKICKHIYKRKGIGKH